MPRTAIDRLTALDNSFLLLERPGASMHVASVAIHEAGPLATAAGGIDLEKIRRGVSGVLHRIPRYRQKLAWIPIVRSPVWVDDDDFNLDYHIRHTSLPQPGSEEQLKELAARVMAQRLDRTRPLWELWIVEGLKDDRFAVISKVHHCMIDGVSGVDLLSVLMGNEPEPRLVDAPLFVPRRSPSDRELLRDEVLRRAQLPFDVLRGATTLIGEARERRRELTMRLRAMAETLGATFRPATPTPLNQPVGPHRRFDWLSMELDELRQIRSSLGGSLNDVVLAIVAGAVRRFLSYRRVDVSDLEFRVLAPVSVQREDERGRLGNRVSAWVVPLPLDESDPAIQLERIAQHTEELKTSRRAVGAEALTQVAEWTPATLLSLGARNATRLLPINLVVTNVPGPQQPMYLMGAPMQQAFPMVPLMEGLGLGIALFSYAGRLCWGFNADYDLVPDLDRFVSFLAEAKEELLLRATETAAPSSSRSASRSAS